MASPKKDGFRTEFGDKIPKMCNEARKKFWETSPWLLKHQCRPNSSYGTGNAKWSRLTLVLRNHTEGLVKKDLNLSLAKERFEVLFRSKKKSLFRNSLRELQKFLKIFLRTFWSSLKIEENIPLNSKDPPPVARKGGGP